MEEVKCYYEGPVSLTQAEQYIEDSLVTTAREYVAIGYWLRRIRDDKLFQEEGYKNFEEYVRQKYRKDGGWASKCIKVNGQFSVDGNSPYLSEQYQGYSKYQLVELAYMTEEQRELVDTSTSIRDMKQLRKPEPEPESQAAEPEEESQPELVTSQVERVAAPQEEVPEPEVLHFIAGDRTIDNAYGATIAAVVRAYLDSGYSRPEKECEVTAFGLIYKVLKRQDVTVFYTDVGQTVFDVENARLEKEYQYWHGTKAEPEPAKPTPPEPEQDSCPPGIADCRRQEWGTEPVEQEAGKKECKACWASWKRQHKALGAAVVEQEPEGAQQEPKELQDPLSAYGTPKRVYPEDSLIAMVGCEGGHSCTCCHVECGIRQEDCYCVEAPMGNPFPCDTLKSVQTLRDEIGSRCQFVDNSLAYHRVGDHEPVPCCRECEEPCGYICGRAKKQLEAKADILQKPNSPEDIIDSDFTEIQEPEKDIQEPEEPLTELQIAQGELERAKRLLEKGLGCGVDENDIHIRQLKTAVCAWASYVRSLGAAEEPRTSTEQPKLPVLKNNDQRAAFVDAYETWPLWIETEQTGERYYRYDLADGTSMVVKVYHARIFDGYTPGSYEAQYHDGYGRHEYYLLQPGKFFRDCDTNRSLLIEKLKEIQKAKKG